MKKNFYIKIEKPFYKALRLFMKIIITNNEYNYFILYLN